MKVLLGAHNISNSGVGDLNTIRMPVSKVINHEMFNIIGEKAFDIALIKLNVS